jgi:hypothetical protein
MTRALQLATATLLVLAAASSTSAAAHGLSEGELKHLDASVEALANAQARVFGSSAAFCAANEKPQGRPTDASLSSFLGAFRAGTRAGMIEIAANDKDILSSGPSYQDRDFEMMDKQAAAMLAAIQSSAALGCKKLADILESGTAEAFKQQALDSHREYKAKRAAYCAREPKPKNCD